MSGVCLDALSHTSILIRARATKGPIRLTLLHPILRASQRSVVHHLELLRGQTASPTCSGYRFRSSPSNCQPGRYIHPAELKPKQREHTTRFGPIRIHSPATRGNHPGCCSFDGINAYHPARGSICATHFRTISACKDRCPEVLVSCESVREKS